MPLLDQFATRSARTSSRTILDFFRLEFAIDSENYLTQSRIKENEKHFRELLRSAPGRWTATRNCASPFSSARPAPQSAKLSSKSMGPASALGKFIKLYVRQRRNLDRPQPQGRSTTASFILS
jgi:hypothetical protein